MINDTSEFEAPSAGRAIVQILASFPIACFTCALGTDIAYSQTAEMIWADASAWLLAAGLAMSVIAALAGLIHLIASRHVPRARSPWPVVAGSVAVLVLAVFDNLVHSRDAWTSVVPTGMILSLLLVAVMLVTAWFGLARRVRPEYAMQHAGMHR